MGTYPGIDYFRLAEVIDVVSWDNYPQWTATSKDIEIGAGTSFAHDLTRSLKGKPFMLMESSPSATNWRPVAKLHRPNVHMLQSMQAVAHGSDTVQYFQFRKSRGASEKFHGAVVDHEGTENTRVFRDVAAVGERLKTMDAVIGTGTPTAAAIIYDWNVRWALEDVKGFLQKDTGYVQTVIDHYHAFWQLGIPVDIIDQSIINQSAIGQGRSLEDYDLVAAPMLYLLRPGFAEAVDAFVQKGGVFVATYGTGWVNESDLVFRGGIPGPLRKCLGVWCEEIDALYPEDRNSIVWDGKRYETFDLCELIHAESAKVLGTYGSDFYAGRPALTVNQYGSGRAFFIAARTGKDFLGDFYARITRECGVKPVLETPLPSGVTAQIRSGGKTEHIFVMNFTPEKKTVDAGALGKRELEPYEVWITGREI
jgi:beta-galactosidase